jgi:UPF0042 nucleotide-binding protein
MKEVSIIILSGLSGSGKSTALRTLEDLGFFCIDNLPILLLPRFIELCYSSTDDISRVALVVDARSLAFLEPFQNILMGLENKGYNIKRIFLECSDDVLIRRFSETRRQHPSVEGGSVLEGIRTEREMISEMRCQADRVIDTTDMNVRQLKEVCEECFEGFSKRDMAITFMSFGYKYGVPHDADIVLDVRFLSNPFFVEELKELTGNDKEVLDYVFNPPETKEFLKMTVDYLSFQIPLFEREGKSYLTVAVGCTGGKHRSVAVAGYLKDIFSRGRDRVYSRNREL